MISHFVCSPRNQQPRQSSLVDGRQGDGDAGEAGTEHATIATSIARLDHDEEKLDRVLFDVMWPRHTGRFWPLRWQVTLEEAFAIIEKEGLLWPT